MARFKKKKKINYSMKAKKKRYMEETTGLSENKTKISINRKRKRNIEYAKKGKRHKLYRRLDRREEREKDKLERSRSKQTKGKVTKKTGKKAKRKAKAKTNIEIRKKIRENKSEENILIITAGSSIENFMSMLLSEDFARKEKNPKWTVTDINTYNELRDALYRYLDTFGEVSTGILIGELISQIKDVPLSDSFEDYINSSIGRIYVEVGIATGNQALVDKGNDMQMNSEIMSSLNKEFYGE